MNNGGVLLEVEKEYKKQYRISSWWIEHRRGLVRAGLVAFACVDGLLLLFVAWTFFDAYALRYNEERRAVLELAAYGQSDLNAYTRSTAAEGLDVRPAVAVASSTAGKYDLYATVQNPNEDWWAEFTYAFASSAMETDLRSGYVLPGEKKPMVAFAVASEAPPRSVTLSIRDIVWHRVDHHLTGDYAAWAVERLNLTVENVSFSTVPLESSSVGRVTFTVSNDTAYGYYDPEFVVTLLRGSTVIGTTGTVLDSLAAGETREVSLNWFGPVPSPTKVEAAVFVNPFDMESYKPLEGETTEDTRARVQPRGRR